MRLRSLTPNNTDLKESQLAFVYNIKNECSQFIQESGGLPLTKTLSENTPTIKKVKVRHRKGKHVLGEMLDNTFDEALQSKAVFCSPHDEDNQYYIFPPNGYQFLYSNEIKDSSIHSQYIYDQILQSLNEEDATSIFKEMLKISYTNENLFEGLQSKSEIILFDIPYFYAISTDAIDYPSFLNMLYN